MPMIFVELPIMTKLRRIITNNIPSLINSPMVGYKHFQTVGIGIYAKGDRVQILEQESQMPLGEATVAGVEVLNINTTVLTLEDISGRIEEGMIVESLTDNAEAMICNNVFRNNRARGMLLASKGKTCIMNNHFNSGGAAIQFESDPFSWYECGGTKDIVIEGNFFDDCKYGKWGRGVIDICKRRKVVEGFYYHDSIRIVNNKFTQETYPCVCADNVGNLTFEGNEYAVETPVVATHCIYNGEKFD